MVMKRSMMRKNLRQSILKSFGRYAAIAIIIALGAAMFVGLRSTRNDMVATGQIYMDRQNMFDLRLLTSYGWNKEQLDDIRAMEGIEEAEGLFYMDLIVNQDSEGADAVYRFYSLPDRINQLVLLCGRMPEADNECLADGFRNSERILGTKITISDENEEDSLEKLVNRTFTIVGCVSTPLYMDMNRGNTSVGNGSISNYFFVPENAFDADYYSEIHVMIPGNHKIYTEEYNDFLSDMADTLEVQLKPLAEERLKTVKKDAREAYSDGVKEYTDGLKEYQEEREKTQKDLFDARKDIDDGKDTLIKSEKSLIKGEKQIANAKKTIVSSRRTLAASRETLAETRVSTYEQIADANEQLMENYSMLTENMAELEAGMVQINAGIAELDSGIMQIETGISQLDIAIQQIDTMINVAKIGLDTAESALEMAEIAGTDPELISQLREQMDGYYTSIEEYEAQKQELLEQRNELQAQLDDLNAQKSQIIAQKNELEDKRHQIQAGLAQVDAGFAELISQQAMAEKQFAAAEAQIQAGEAQLIVYEGELATQEENIKKGWIDLEQGKKDWLKGFREYKDGKLEAAAEFRDAEADLAEAAQKLQDARETILKMNKNDLFVLDRNSNVGYSSLDSSSNIVAGISRVFPAFFLLVAALVCITTMTRMVDEERTQIGTLKALGYSNMAIISKYLVYAGSSAILGCTTGVILGSVGFPIVLWEAYKIMIFITPAITLRFDWALCLAVIVSYTTVMLLVTWYCCRRELKEVPAELIRPRAPASGKELILEKLALWKKISFLNKVAIRNIFRYRQRLAMMMLGIGGCAGLLLTGFGLRDTIMDIADIQFEEVAQYDMEVYFQSDRTDEEQREFCEKLAPYAKDIMFYAQSSAEIDGNSQTKDITVITASEHVVDFIDFHKGNETIKYPGVNQLLLTSGMAEMLGVRIGDNVVLRNLDLEKMELTVSGIYDNHVRNYAVICPETMEQQWGRSPENQMAFVKVKEGHDSYAVGAVVNGLSGVMNVSVSEELAATVGTMMKALNLVILVVVFCAALLAAIVLYNLTNINITERIREIATIKVLGFNAFETAMYVFKENLALSVMGSAFGMLLGHLLLRFVVSQVKIDMIWLQARLSMRSYVLSITMTLLMGILVDLIFYFRLEKINMAEALKSVE